MGEMPMDTMPIVVLRLDAALWHQIELTINILGCGIQSMDAEDDWVTLRVTAVSAEVIQRIIDRFQ